MTVYSEDDLLLLSGIQHFAFCRRQWALIHIEQQWQDKLKADLASLEQVYRQRTQKAEHEIMARLPLDKHRLRSERAERLLQEAASAFSASLPEISADLALRSISMR
mgnify:CR=1 FL=1